MRRHGVAALIAACVVAPLLWLFSGWLAFGVGMMWVGGAAAPQGAMAIGLMVLGTVVWPGGILILLGAFFYLLLGGLRLLRQKSTGHRMAMDGVQLCYLQLACVTALLLLATVERLSHGNAAVMMFFIPVGLLCLVVRGLHRALGKGAADADARST